MDDMGELAIELIALRATEPGKQLANIALDFLPERGGMRSEYHAAARIGTACMLARAAAGVR
jgi:hypothetical protein